jgi:KipI family sensor histidine kinase inhibitor
VRVLPMGPRAVLIEDLGADPADWADGLRGMSLAGVTEVVPAARTVLVTCADSRSLAQVRERLATVRAADPARRASAAPIVIPIRYDGEDLELVASSTGLEVEDVVAIHSGAEYVVAFCGFAPGFGYLRGLDPRLHLPRRATPRTRVPAGSVAIAAEYTAVYPRASPGGWLLLGTTASVMFDPDRSPPVLLEPGAHVRFVVS